jgi:glycosyltransferase involved in cell wall biosynthesis
MNIRKGNLNITIIIPAHNEASNVGEVIKKCLKCTPNVLVIDDGSTDNTSQVAVDNGASVYRSGRKSGIGGATNAGFLETKNADIIVTVDGDGQHNADEIPKLLAPLLRGEADMVIGSRFINGIKIPKYRRFGIWMITLAYNFGHKPITDSQCGFRAFSREFIDSINPTDNGIGSFPEIIVKARKRGFRIVEVPISCIYRNLEQDSNMNPFKHGIIALVKTVEWRIREWN